MFDRPIGIANAREIKVNNPTHSLTLQLVSISGNQPDFHSSFFVSKVEHYTSVVYNVLHEEYATY